MTSCLWVHVSVAMKRVKTKVSFSDPFNSATIHQGWREIVNIVNYDYCHDVLKKVMDVLQHTKSVTTQRQLRSLRWQTLQPMKSADCLPFNGWPLANCPHTIDNWPNTGKWQRHLLPLVRQHWYKKVSDMQHGYPPCKTSHMGAVVHY